MCLIQPRIKQTGKKIALSDFNALEKVPESPLSITRYLNILLRPVSFNFSGKEWK